MGDDRRLRVLIVEDNPADRTLAVRELQRQFPTLEVISARTEEELRTALAAGEFDAVITDYQLNWSDGLQVLQATKQQYPHCPVIMFTASGSQEVAVEAMKAGLDDYVVKAPSRYVRLPIALGAALHREEQRRAIRAAQAERDRLDAELRLRAEELAERDRRKDEFLAVLGHELRNPLNVLSNALLLLDQRRAGDERDALIRGRALRQVRHLTRLVNDLLDAARVTQGHLSLEHQAVELNRLLREVEEDFGAAAARRNQQIELDLPDIPILVYGDPIRLTQVVTNLTENAVKYSPEHTTICLRLEPEGEQAVLTVADQGHGIAPDAIPRLFDMFTQVSRSPTQAEGGLGIGLYLVQSLVALHGGSVEVRSNGEDPGSSFIVRLPLATP